MSAADDSPRLWGGTTLEERRRERRTQLIEAGIRLIAGGGGQAVSVRAVCREAGLTSRYFYEQFEDRDQFTVAVFRSVAEELQAAITEAVAGVARSRGVPSAAVTAVLEVAIDNPDKGRVLFVAPTTDPVLFAARNRSLSTLAGMIADQIPDRDPPDVRRLKAASLTGALNHVFYLFVDGQLGVSREAFVAHCVALLRTVSALR